MEGQTSKKHLYWLINVIVVAVIVLSIYYVVLREETSNGITAKEAKLLADEYAAKWDSTAGLFYLGALANEYGEMENISRTGKNIAWRLDYISGTIVVQNSTEYYTRISICVNKTGVVDTLESLDEITYDRDSRIVNDWEIDSPEAINIAKSNSSVRALLDTIDNFKFGGCRLGMYKGDVMWRIEWFTNGMENYISIGVDANTGECSKFEYDVH